MVVKNVRLEKGYLYYVDDCGVLYKVFPKINVPISKKINIETGEIIYPTNADRIRNMTNSEIAEYLYDICDCDHADVPCKKYCGNDPCKIAWLRWLGDECTNG